MSRHFFQNAQLRTAMLRGYRMFARAQFWRSGPRVFVNSLPKAGTHLLTSELNKLPAMQNSRLHIDGSMIDRSAAGARRHLTDRDVVRFSHLVGSVRRGQFFTAHLMWSQELTRALDRRAVRTVFMTRDPRDILTSRLHYILGLRRHWLHDRLVGGFANDEDRYRFLINGHEGPRAVISTRSILAGYLPWTTDDRVLTVRFEELVGAAGGGSASAKRDTLHRIAEHCGIRSSEIEAIDVAASIPTATLRKGQVGSWRSELPPAIIALMNEKCGDLIAAYGYDAA